MKTQTTALLTLSVLTLTTATVAAQPAEPQPQPPVPVLAPVAAPVAPAAAQPAVATATATVSVPAAAEGPRVESTGWTRPPGARLLHGIRLGYNFISNYDVMTRGCDSDGNNCTKSLKDEFGIQTPHTMILGYEAMYRIVGHSWLNVIMVGNVSVAGLEQSKFIPTASGLIGAELNHSFQIGIGVNLTPDKEAPSHMIAAVGWTPKVGSIYTPVHFFFVPDPAGNHRSGATIGVTW